MRPAVAAFSLALLLTPALRAADEVVRDWRYILTIHEIARADDDERLSKLLSDNPDRARLRTPDGRTPVHFAAEAGSLKSLRALGKAGADLNVVDDKKRTPLSVALGLDYANTIRTLIDLGADPNKEGALDDAPPRPPLQICARRGAVDVMKVLLDAKADVNKRAADGSTALMGAVQSSHWDAMALLLERNANPNVKDKDSVTPLLYAVAAREPKAIKALLDHKADPTIADSSGRTPLLVAVTQNDADLVKALLNAGATADVYERGTGRSALTVSENPAIWQLLIDKGAKTDVFHGAVPRLQHYIAGGDVARVKAWLQYKPDPFLTDRQGRTAKEIARKLSRENPYNADRNTIARMVEEYQKAYALEQWEKEKAAPNK